MFSTTVFIKTEYIVKLYIYIIVFKYVNVK